MSQPIRVCVCSQQFVNDPSAGSPTERCVGFRYLRNYPSLMGLLWLSGNRLRGHRPPRNPAFAGDRLSLKRPPVLCGDTPSLTVCEPSPPPCHVREKRELGCGLPIVSRYELASERVFAIRRGTTPAAAPRVNPSGRGISRL